MTKKITMFIESLEHGDETVEKTPEEAVPFTKKKLNLGNFAVTNNGEVLDNKTPEKELAETVEKSNNMTFHEKRKPG